MIVFGGEKQYLRQDKIQRECNNEIKQINLQTFEAKTFKASGIIEARKAHAATIYGKSLIIHGGINSRRNYLSEMLVYEIITQKWSRANVE